jgi:hypothetical protein
MLGVGESPTSCLGTKGGGRGPEGLKFTEKASRAELTVSVLGILYWPPRSLGLVVQQSPPWSPLHPRPFRRRPWLPPIFTRFFYDSLTPAGFLYCYAGTGWPRVLFPRSSNCR